MHAPFRIPGNSCVSSVSTGLPPSRRRLALAGCLLSAAAGLGALSGCGQDATRPVRESAGRIEGFVDGGNGPVRALVRALPAASPEGSRYEATADSSGHYALEAPQGDYFISVESEGQRYYFTRRSVTQRAYGDTLRIEEEPRRVDFLFSDLALDLATVPELNGREVTLQAESASGEDRIVSPTVTRVIAEGRADFLFPWLPQGTYHIRATVAGAVPFWVYQSVDAEHGVTVSLRHGETTLQHWFLDAPGRIRGRIVGSWQEMGSPPPQVTIFQSVSDIVGTVEASADGSFVLESFVSGAFRFRVDIEGFRRWWGGESYESARVAELQPGEVTALPEYEESGILLTLAGPGGAPVGPARIDLRDAGQHPVTPSDFVSDSDAPVRIPNLVPGQYFLRVEPAAAGAGWCPRSYGAAHANEPGTPIEITGDPRTVRIRMDLRSEGTLSGTVTFDAADAPGRVILETSDGGVEVARVQCDSLTGAFSITCVPPGTYKMAAVGHFLPDNFATWYPGTRSREEAAEIRVEDSSVISGLDWILQ